MVDKKTPCLISDKCSLQLIMYPNGQLSILVEHIITNCTLNVKLLINADKYI